MMMKKLKSAILAVFCGSALMLGVDATASTLSPDAGEKETRQQQASVDAASALAELLSRYQSLAADFQQYTLSQEGTREERSSGSFVLERPDRFDWYTRTPYEQRIISDGQYIWIHDIDLEQVTRKSAAAGGGSAPALILNGDVAALQQRFVIELLEQEGERAIYQLLPKDEEGNFVRIRLLFKAGVLGELLLEDSLGQRTTILLDGIRLNPEVNADRFEFEPPPGVDVILDAGG